MSTQEKNTVYPVEFYECRTEGSENRWFMTVLPGPPGSNIKVGLDERILGAMADMDEVEVSSDDWRNQKVTPCDLDRACEEYRRMSGDEYSMEIVEEVI
jgi:hypothetical protein